MAGTERDDSPGDDAPVSPDSGAKTDSIGDEEDEKRRGHLASLSARVLGENDGNDEEWSGVLSRFRGDAEDSAEASDEDDADDDETPDVGDLLAIVRERFQDEDTGPSKAELVDGATVLFIDSAAKRKPLYEYDLVLITAPSYPEPVVLKNDVPIEIPEGSVLCSAESATMIDYGGKRLIARPCILVPPERADEVSQKYLEEVPEGVVGERIQQRGIHDEDFYNLVLSAVGTSSE